MKQKLSSWWEEKPTRAYVAKRSLVTPEQTGKFAPFTRFIVYYCGADFDPQKAERKQAGITYLINGEKEPPNAQEDSPWMVRAEELVSFVGGVIRQEEAEIIPVLYVSLGFEDTLGALEFSSDQVPVNEDANRTVRVVCGQFENVAHSVPVPQDVTVLDVVLSQGGKFAWKLPPKQRAFIYIVSGNVRIGQEETLSSCRTDTLVWAVGKNIHVTTECSGGRLLVVTVPSSQEVKEQEAYVQEILPDLDKSNGRKERA